MTAGFEVIPAIDLREGKCVRLVQGDYDRQITYSGDPVAVALKWQEMGAPRLHVVDLDGAKQGEPANLDVAGAIARSLNIPCDFGGGVRTAQIASSVLEAGFERFSIGTRALDTDFAQSIFHTFGDAAIADIASRDGKVSVAGWQQATEVDAFELAVQLQSLGCRRIIYTDISRDGSLGGPNIDAVRGLASRVEIPVVASGGVASVSDLLRLSELHEIGVEGAITGKALYDGRIDLGRAIAAVAGAGSV